LQSWAAQYWLVLPVVLQQQKTPIRLISLNISPGTTVSNPSNWTLSPDRTGCDGEDKSCKIELAADYVEVTATQTIIDSTILPQLPTTMSEALFEVPDATSGVYEHIYNQDQ